MCVLAVHVGRAHVVSPIDTSARPGDACAMSDAKCIHAGSLGVRQAKSALFRSSDRMNCISVMKVEHMMNPKTGLSPGAWPGAGGLSFCFVFTFEQM